MKSVGGEGRNRSNNLALKALFTRLCATFQQLFPYAFFCVDMRLLAILLAAKHDEFGREPAARTDDA
jgi:hypothetical protein